MLRGLYRTQRRWRQRNYVRCYPTRVFGEADLFEISKTPSPTEQSQCPADPTMVRVVGKRLDTGHPGYLVLCWVYPDQGEIVTATLDRHFRAYDNKISGDTARRERLSCLRPRKRSRTHESQDWNQTRKKLKTHASASPSASQSQTYPSRQIAEDCFVNSNDRSVNMELIYIIIRATLSLEYGGKERPRRSRDSACWRALGASVTVFANANPFGLDIAL